MKYKNSIKGYISKGKLASLEGVSVKLLFMWVNIVEVSRRGDYLVFSVVITGADFPIDNFEECPQCGCGVNCSNQLVRKIKKTPFVSSLFEEILNERIVLLDFMGPLLIFD